MSISLQERQMGDVTVVDIAGRVTLTFLPGDRDIVDPNCGSRKLRDKFQKLVANKQKWVLLNLGEVSYIDSSGIGELVSAFTSVKNAGGELKLLNLTKKVHDLLQITKLYTVFDIWDSETSAVSAFK